MVCRVPGPSLHFPPTSILLLNHPTNDTSSLDESLNKSFYEILYKAPKCKHQLTSVITKAEVFVLTGCLRNAVLSSTEHTGPSLYFCRSNTSLLPKLCNLGKSERVTSKAGFGRVSFFGICFDFLFTALLDLSN